MSKQEDRTAYVIEQMAQGHVGCDDMGCECLYCNSTELYGDKQVRVGNYYELVAHEADCPILVARQILREQGTPLNVYRLTGHTSRDKKRIRWEESRSDVLAISEDKALRAWSHLLTRNVQVQFIAIWPEETK